MSAASLCTHLWQVAKSTELRGHASSETIEPKQQEL